MPYKSINELPEGVRHVLPKHAQEIYKEAYNNALTEYADPDKRRGDESQEEVSRRVAWAAVKKAGYKKTEAGAWRQ
ncbi:MAG TPA: ChaB family protein [Dongiaceae bacterium]|nr:ChaB family protein [Dongiaceae bacterium]